MNSTITIDDSDEEVIDLDCSQNSINITDNQQSECSMEKSSLSNDFANKTDPNSDYEETNKIALKSETTNDTNTSKPLLKVMFRDESVARQYSTTIEKFLEKLISSKIRCQQNDSDLTLAIWDGDNDSTSQSIQIVIESDESQDIISNMLFTVDKQPKSDDTLDVPTYKKKYEDIFEKAKLETDEKPIYDCTPKVTCFNCGDNHMLRECPKPRNKKMISEMKKNFHAKGNTKYLRYHLEDDQKFAHMIPGQLSSNLCKALGLKNNELPKHIYRMRTLGYPPGWLEEARLQHSGLSLFNSNGIAEQDPDEELGSIYEEGDRDQYDIKKIYDFPGFNVPPPPGVHDEQGQYWKSKMQAMNSKQRMLQMLRGRTADEGYKRKKLKRSNDITKDDSIQESCEMDIETLEEGIVECVPITELFASPSIRESIAKPEPSISLSHTVSEDSDDHSQELQFSESPEVSISLAARASSPSLTKLEIMKKHLLVELQESNSNSDDLSKNSASNTVTKSDIQPSSNEGILESSRIFQESNSNSGDLLKSDSCNIVTKSDSQPFSNEETPEPNRILQESNTNSDDLSKIDSCNVVTISDIHPSSNEGTPESNRIRQNGANTSCGSIKSVNFGTPVFQSTSPYSKLPSSDKFSKNICDVINFENLPDSTGKYEQMTGVLRKVRTTLSKLNQEWL